MREKTQKTTEHLALMSIKQEVPVSDLFNAIVSARENGKSKCQALNVEFRGNIKREAVFLVTNKYVIVGQFRVEEDFLLRKNIRFDDWMDSDKVRRQIKRQKLKKLSTLVQDLRKGMRKVNLEAEVLETLPPARVCTRYGNNATVTNALITDGTGSVKLCIWNEQELFVRAGDTIQIKNAAVLFYKGERQLHLGKNGTLSVLNKTD